jgi:hypothetical protein
MNQSCRSSVICDCWADCNPAINIVFDPIIQFGNSKTEIDGIKIICIGNSLHKIKATAY